MTYDSQFERRIAPILQSLGFVRSNDYFRLDGSPQQFRDKEGAKFCAKPDWHHPQLNLYVETKAGTLNSKTTVRTAASAEAHRREYCRIQGRAFNVGDMFTTQWSHSKTKQALVQRALTPQHLIIVFERPVPYETMLKYRKAGLVAIHLAALPNFLRYIRLCRYGLPVNWWLPYEEEGQAFVL